MSVPKKIPMLVKCYYCRETINLTRQSDTLITADHICMSETAKAKRDRGTEAEIQALREENNRLFVALQEGQRKSK